MPARQPSSNRRVGDNSRLAGHKVGSGMPSAEAPTASPGHQIKNLGQFSSQTTPINHPQNELASPLSNQQAMRQSKDAGFFHRHKRTVIREDVLPRTGLSSIAAGLGLSAAYYAEQLATGKRKPATKRYCWHAAHAALQAAADKSSYHGTSGCIVTERATRSVGERVLRGAANSRDDAIRTIRARQSNRQLRCNFPPVTRELTSTAPCAASGETGSRLRLLAGLSDYLRMAAMTSPGSSSRHWRGALYWLYSRIMKQSRL